MNPQIHLGVFLIVAMTVAITTQILLPFPIGLIVALSLFVIFPLTYRRYILKNGSMLNLGSSPQVRFVCIVCGSSKSSGGKCKKCGSNQFKIQ